MHNDNEKPLPPAPAECCENGCEPCVWDTYREELAAWNEKQKAAEKLIAIFLSNNPDWSLKQNKLYRQFVFSDFVSAIEFMNNVALVAEQQNHHPEWCNVYNKVEVYLISHDAQSITDKDFALAQSIDEIYTVYVGR